MKKSFWNVAVLGVMVMASFSFTGPKQSDEIQREKQDTLGTEVYKNQVEVPVVRDSIPPPMPDLPVPPDSFPPPPPSPVPDSIPHE